ncbi:hypothetical protein GBAR_LOCUS4937 [Geodia barretti]|uniref:Uncharacterized protein n=1 Tax=Geodia barretti TaxID=519541 RepID=A0AA35R9L4_GEOBA|nr:hypothetical protein GBAR_LOCUS4937 [Geodia barretti]
MSYLLVNTLFLRSAGQYHPIGSFLLSYGASMQRWTIPDCGRLMSQKWRHTILLLPFQCPTSGRESTKECQNWKRLTEMISWHTPRPNTKESATGQCPSTYNITKYGST